MTDASELERLIERLYTRALDIQLGREPQEFVPTSMLLQQAANALKALRPQPEGAGNG